MEIHCFQRGRRTLELFIHVCNVTTVLKYCTVTTKVSVVLLLQQQIVLDQSWDVSRDCQMQVPDLTCPYLLSPFSIEVYRTADIGLAP